jgi:hypothetical protein
MQLGPRDQEDCGPARCRPEGKAQARERNLLRLGAKRQRKPK